MNVVIITLFEKQIIRNYTSDDLEFISRLASKYEVIIFTNKQNFKLMSDLLEGIKLKNIRVKVLSLNDISPYLRAIMGLLKWSHGSTTIIREIKLKYILNYSSIVTTFFKIVINSILRNFHSFDVFLRYLVHKNFKLEEFLSSLNPELREDEFLNCKTVFITSLTNINDLQVALLAKKMNLKIIGTVRSWDNLTSHGNLSIFPDIFYSHSGFMTDTLKEFHNFDPRKIVTLTAPNYREIFRPLTVNDKSKAPLKIGYGCMGGLVNPDDKNFMIYFNQIASQNLDKDFFIIQHPIFPHEIDFDLSSNLSILQFDYQEFNLANYYARLSHLDLLVGGGSSILLDAVFLKIPIGFIAFEVIHQKYWTSALRYEDYVYHFQKFIEFTGVKVLRSKNELIDFFNNCSPTQDVIDINKSGYFFGNIQIDLNDELLNLLD